MHPPAAGGARTSLLPAAIALAAAALVSCNGDSTGPIDLVSTVVLTPASPVTEVGLGVQLTATALDAGGATLSGLTATWASEDPGVATVSEGGLASGVSVGTSTIVATIGSVSDSVTLTVEPSRCDDAADVLLAPGDHATFGADECLRLPAGAPRDRYRIALIRPTQVGNPSDTTRITLRINPVAVAAEPPVAAGAPWGAAPATPDDPAGASDAPTAAGAEQAPDLPGIDGRSVLEALALERRTLRFHAALRLRERALGLDRLTALPTPPQRVAPLRVDPPSSRSFRLAFNCGDGTATPATLVAFNDDLAIYQDTEERDAEPVSQAAADRMLDYYSDYIRDMSNRYWGQTPDIDGNARVLVTTSPELADTVAAAVFSGDFVSTADCASSDEGELIYFSADAIREMDGSEPQWFALGTLAHEAKHVTSLYHGVARGPSFHPLWIEEGTAEIATGMSSRIAWAAIGGPPVGTPITREDIIAAVTAHQQGGGPGDRPPEIDGVISNLANLAALIVQLSTHPNSLITNPGGADELHTFYAAGWHMNRFVGDAWGNAASALADSALFRALTDSTGPAGDAAGLVQLTGRTFDQLFGDLAVAASMHGVAGVAQPVRAFTTYDFVSATDIFSGPEQLTPPGVYPWPVTGDDTSPSDGFTSATYTTLAGPSGVHFYDFVSNTGLDALVRVTNAPGSTLVVTRLR